MSRRCSYNELVEQDAPCRVSTAIWADYFGISVETARSHARCGRIPTNSDHIGLMLINPAWHLTWRDKRWAGAGKGYVYEEGLRSDLPFGSVDPRVGERTIGLPL